MAAKETRLPSEALRWTCDSARLGAGGTKEVPPVEGTIGQDRGMRALRVGLDLQGRGFNVFVAGLSGTGRTSTVKKLLGDLAPKRDVPHDRIYVHNFDNPECPTLLTLPFGRGAELAREMAAFTRLLQHRLPRLFDDKKFARRRNELVTRYGERERDAMQALAEKLGEEGFTLGQVQVGSISRPSVFAVIEEQLVSEDRIYQLVDEGTLPKEAGEELLKKYKGFRGELQEALRTNRKKSRRMLQEVHALLQESARVIFEGDLSDIRILFEGEAKVLAYLDQVEKDLLEETVLLPGQEDPDETPEDWRLYIEESLLRYTVNVLTDHSKTKGSPVVVENFPSFVNLFGTIERVPLEGGMMGADHRHIIAGSLLKADGGYIILSARDVFSEPEVWEALKRSLKTRRLEIHPPQDGSPFSVTALKPEPIAIDTKVIMIGDPGVYDVLYNNDTEFRKIFKIKADFDSSMERTDENLLHFAAVVALICKQEDLLPLDAKALGVCMEVAVREAGRRNRISTRFNELGDVIREASFLAAREGKSEVTEDYVHRTVTQMIDRHRLLEEQLHDLIEEDVLMISTDGWRVGQVNGLSVYVMGYHSFGKPTRITAVTAAGGVGIINVEREARLSGGIYDKGVLIIAGWMRRMFAQDRPLSLTASLCFEQSYSGVDGDSASVAEICAVLSELSGIPIDQGFAVTGSVNQHGEVQPIGGVNEKIEGFFSLCKSRGLTGTQGCVIPKRNVEDLMLPPKVVAAVEAGDFCIHAVEYVEEAITILTGLPASPRDQDGNFPGGSVYDLAEKKLVHYAAASRPGNQEMSSRLLATDREPPRQ